MLRSLLFAFLWAGLFTGLSAQFVSTTNTGLGQLECLAVDPQGNRYVSDRSGNRVLRIDTDNTPTVYCSSGLSLPTGLVRVPSGELYVANHTAGTVSVIPPGGGPATVYASGISYPRGLAADAAGNLYVGEYFSQRILKVAPGGAVSVVVGNAGITGSLGGNDRLEHLAIEPTGDLIATIGFSSPGRVYRIALPSGTPTLLATSPLLAGAFAINVNQNTGNIYITGVTGHRILSLTPQGAVSVVTGDGTNATLDGPLDLARFSEPSGITVDPGGNIWISQFGGAVRRIGLQPAEVPTNGLRLWLRADRGLLRNGNTVTQWLDQSGSANHATPTGALFTPQPPTFVTDVVNGYPAVRFNGVNTGLTTPAFQTFPNKRGTIFSVVRVNAPSSTSSGGYGTIAGTYYAASGTTWQYGGFPGQYSFYDGVGLSNFNVASNPPNVWGIATFMRDADNAFQFYKSGVSVGGGSLANNQPSPLPVHIGWNDFTSPGTWEVLNGDIAELIIYDGALSPAELEQVNAYLADKYSFNGDVPLPTAQGTTVCGSGTATLTATGGDAYRWYDSPDATVPLATTSSFITPVLTGTTTYYVANFNGQLQSQRVPVTVTVLQPGAACNDGNPNTTNDVLDSNCNCLGQPINTISFTFDPTPLCADNATNYSVFMTATGSYNFPGNNWVVEMSDISGSFASPTVVAFTGFNALFGELVFQVPLNTPAGTGYRIRVRSTDPVVISADNGVDLTVVAPILWYADYDGDGFGDPNESVLTCAAPPGFVANDGDNCVGEPGIIGSACDDGNPNTVNDVLVVGCFCAGTPVNGCTTDLDLIWQPDGVSSLTWELREQGTNILVQSGGGIYPNVDQYSEATCLPNGCFYLVVTDDGGDGIAGGGYLLKVNSAARLIDNLVDAYGNGGFTSGFTSQIDGNEGFCLPVGSDRLIFTSCDRVDWKTSPCGGEFVVANDNAAVTAQFNVNNANSGYQMWWYNPNGGYSFKRFQSHNTSNGLPVSATRACHFQLNAWSGNQLQQGVLYNVKVRGRVNGVYNPWGPACRLVVNNTLAQCPRTKLMDQPGNQYLSCGQSRAIGTNVYVHAKPARRMNNNCNWVNANRYQFRFRIPAENITIVKTGAVGAGQYFVNTNGLACNKTYEVDVRVSFDGGSTWCHSGDQWGDICLLTTTCSFGMAQEGGNATDAAAEAKVAMYPNPNRGDQLFLQLSELEAGVEKVTVDIFDGFGKRVATRTLGAQDGYVNTAMELNELANGMYLVSISAGSKTFNERLVIQK